VVIRCLTARAVQKVLLSLQEVDGWAARWLNTFCATHPPLDGDKVRPGWSQGYAGACSVITASISSLVACRSTLWGAGPRQPASRAACKRYGLAGLLSSTLK
jgi:hypothetical protein